MPTVRRLALIAIGLGVVLGTVLAILATGVVGLLAPFALAAVVYTLPGYLIVRALLGEADAGQGELALLSVGMSIVVVALAALVLTLTPVGISPIGWIAFFAVFTAVALGALYLQDIPLVSTLPAPIPIASRDVSLLAAAALLVIVAVSISARSAETRADPGFTELWIERRGEGQVAILVRSRELEGMSYRLVATQGTSVVLDQELALEPDALRELVVEADARSAVDVDLFRLGEESPYREVRLAADAEAG